MVRTKALKPPSWTKREISLRASNLLGRKTQIISDERGNPLAIRDAAGCLTRIECLDQNLATRIIDPTGEIWRREYAAEGHLFKEIDPLRNTTSSEFDMGPPVARTDALGKVTRMQWNDAGQRVGEFRVVIVYAPRCLALSQAAD